MTFTATLSAAAAADVTATWTASIGSGDTAADADLGSTKTGMVTVPMGEDTATFDVPTAQDTANEGNETFTVTLSGVSSNATLAADPTAKGTIEDDDLPVVTIVRDHNTFIEGQEAGFTLSRTGTAAALTTALTVTVEVTQQEDRDVLPDGAAAERTVTFAADSATAALSVALEDDNIREAPGVLTVEVQRGTGYTLGDPFSASVDVIDGGDPTATPANLSASAGAGPGEVGLSWDAYAPHLVFVLHQYQYKTDGAYGDWKDIPNSGQETTGAGDGSNLTGYTVTGLVGGQAHTFQVRTFFSSTSLSAASNEDSATPRSAAVSYGAATYSVNEGATVVVTVSLSGAPGREVTVPVAAAGGGGATAQGETGADWSGVAGDRAQGVGHGSWRANRSRRCGMIDGGGEPRGATPLSPDEMHGLRLPHVTTREQLDELEQANIEQGLLWLARRRRGDILDDAFVRTLHKRLFGDVWKWAGTRALPRTSF